MIVLSCALKQKEVIDVVEKIELNNEKLFKYIKKQGIKMYFETNYENNEEACIIIKKAIKSQSFGNALFFNVASE